MTRLFALATLLCISLSVRAADLPVKPLATKKKPVAVAPVEQAIPQGSQYWLSGAFGALTADDGEMSSRGFGAYRLDDGLLVGARARFNRGFRGVRHGRELGLMLGQPIGSRSWYAVGLGRYEFERRDPNNPERREVIGLPMELVVAPGWSRFGIELRAEANLNTAHPQLMLGVGARFGRLR